jgi:hypothetical protein
MASKTIDFVVRYKGVGKGHSGVMATDEVLSTNQLNIYVPANAAKTNRELVRIGLRTDDVNPGIVDNTMNEMRSNLQGKTLGGIYIYGSSSGGRNAFELARRLTVNNILKIEYVALLDAAFFPNESLFGADGMLGEPTIVPIFDMPMVVAFRMENYFQTAGNHAEFTTSGRAFCSKMAFKEVHGNVPFFEARDLTAGLLKPPPVATGTQTEDDIFHGRLILKATPIVQGIIADILDAEMSKALKLV